MRRATGAERAEQIERYKDAPIVVSVHPEIDGGGWKWSVRGPFLGEAGACVSFNGDGDEARAREMAEEARSRVEANPETYNPSIIWIEEDSDWD